MKAIVISQPMFFPWVGLFEQIRLADIVVHFNDVQLPQGRSFTNRVQIKTKDGMKWLTVPLRRSSSGIRISEALISYDTDWINNHLKFLEANYSKAPHKHEMLNIVTSVYEKKFESISELDTYGIEMVADYFGINKGKEFCTSDIWKLESRKSERLVDIIKNFKCEKYITGWGALNYLDYDLFESRGYQVEFMDYEKVIYRQEYGAFNPFVSILDLIAYEGKAGERVIKSKSVYWKTFIDNERSRTV